ncbi:DUF6491 family protein [Phenylobacterium sp.]|uniref:DUF6491 family protein n=1 Tax=Phenylobacterium sp. TaxID=1871053 RepID=UPI0028979436|nr:DUF6491 family protein [Phenylobacterium sp.]
MKTLIAALAGGAVLLAGAAAFANPAPAERPLGVEARIPFANTTGIRNFRADGDNALWIEGQRGEWYRAELFGPCIGLNHAVKVGFVTRGTNTLDRFGQVLVDGSKCQISSLVTSAEPPPKAKGKKS